MTPPVRLFILLVLLMSLGACAVNPVTGENDFVLMSEDQEIALGRQFSAEVVKGTPRYEDAELQAYVQRVGEGLAAHSHRPGLIYRFSVLDSTDINAFALPGGYIYITRGLLAYLNSEAELAAVLGHEIGHVTARHSVRQHSTATATGLLGSVLASAAGVQGAQELANALGTAFVRGYGREHELEADRLGAEYLARTGYEPRAMLGVIGVLKNQEEFDKQLAREEGREPRAYHGVFSTHPDNDRRLQEVVAAAARVQRPGASRTDREPFLQHLEGLTFGDSEREGILRENHFYHRELDMALSFPAGWRVDNKPQHLMAHAPGNEGSILFTMQDLNRRIPPREFLLQRLGLDTLHNGKTLRHLGMEGYTAISEGESPYGRRPVRYIVFYRGDKALIFAGAAKDSQQPYRYDREVRDTALSFHPLDSRERDLARAQILRLQRATGATRYQTLAADSTIPNHPEAQLRLLNGHYPRGEPQPGSLIKTVR